MIVFCPEHGMTRSAAPLSVDLDPAASVGGGRRRFYLYAVRRLAEDGAPTVCFRLRATLDGLVVLQESRRGLYIICNPITEQWTNLPALARSSVGTGRR